LTLLTEFLLGRTARLFLSELHNVMDHVRLANASKSRGATRSFPAYHSEIFGDELYLEELGFILPIAMLRLRRAPLSLEVPPAPVVAHDSRTIHTPQVMA
jgi:hypothetical protein